MTYTFDSPEASGQKKEQYFEIMGSRAIYQDEWIASVFGPRIPWKAGLDPAIFKWSPDNDLWELHDLSQDYSQAKNVAADHPEKVEALKRAFGVQAEANKVFPVGEDCGLPSSILKMRRPIPRPSSNSPKTWSVFPSSRHRKSEPAATL